MHQETLLSILSRDFELWQRPGMDYNYQQMPISATCRFSVDRRLLNPSIDIVVNFDLEEHLLNVSHKCDPTCSESK